LIVLGRAPGQQGQAACWCHRTRPTRPLSCSTPRAAAGGSAAHLLSPAALADAEPALQLPAGAMSALLLPSDWQLDATLAVHACSLAVASTPPLVATWSSFKRASPPSSGRQKAAGWWGGNGSPPGCWQRGQWWWPRGPGLPDSWPTPSTTPLPPPPPRLKRLSMAAGPRRVAQAAAQQAGSSPGGGEQGAVVPHVRPRKGFLLQLVDPPPALALRHGLMEFDYTANYAPAPSSPPHHSPTPHSGGSSTAAPALPSASPACCHLNDGHVRPPRPSAHWQQQGVRWIQCGAPRAHHCLHSAPHSPLPARPHAPAAATRGKGGVG
ncbi:hypothetical protein CLOM_g13087, partial [Closterium sp. NIES-68]